MSAENTARATGTPSHRVGKLVAPFPLGKSGNPAGKPKEICEMIALARTYTPEAVRGLADIARDTKKAPAAARVMAWNSLLDRAWGEPVQPNLHAINPRAVPPPIDLDLLTRNSARCWRISYCSPDNRRRR